MTDALTWVRANASNPEPDGAVFAGVDADGGHIYVGRAHHEGDLIPGKIVPARSIAYIPWNGQEHSKSEFEVLCNGTYAWLRDSNGSVPEGALEAGKTLSGELLYCGRVRLDDGTDAVGKIQRSHGCLYVPYDGKELSFRDYEVLVKVE